MGPAVLYWGELVVFIAVAWLLGRWAKSPLRFVEWLLLGLGLSTQSWFVFSLTAAWLMTMRWREHWQPAATFARWRFNAVQFVLAAFTFATILTLVFSGIRNGLLAQPDMHVAGTGDPLQRLSTGSRTRPPGAIEGPGIFSVPMWVYRALFFAWATWMAFALVGWLRWAFNAWKANGLWRGKWEEFLRADAPHRKTPGRTPASGQLFDEAFEIALGDRRQALAREFTGLGLIDDLFQRARHEDVSHVGIMLRLAGELVQHGEAAGDLVAFETPVLDRAGEVLAEAGVQKVVVVSNVETGFSKEVGEILL